MLYYLPYINHDVEKLQQLLTFFFDTVEKTNPLSFNTRTLLPNWYSHNNSRFRSLEYCLKYFVESIDRSSQLSIIHAFRSSNEIEYLFNNKKDMNHNVLKISTAEDFLIHKKYLSDLFVSLFIDQLSPKQSTFTKKINGLNLYSHYLDFKKNIIIEKGSFSVCPYCGLEGLKMVESEGRPPYDHLLPKGDFLFIFSAVNLKNLTPIGIICNTLKDTNHLLYTKKDRVYRSIAFYPYSQMPDPFHSCIFRLECIEHPTLRSGGTWEVQITPRNANDIILKEMLETWNRVFNIQNRYAEYISDKGYVMIGNIMKRMSDIDSEEDVRKTIQYKIDNEYELSYPLVAATEGLIPGRIFYEWALSDESFLSGLINAKKSVMFSSKLSSDFDSSDYEN